MFLTQLQHKDVWVRAVKVFAFAFLAAWAITGNALDKTALTSCLAAGLSAVFNYSKQLIGQ